MLLTKTEIANTCMVTVNVQDKLDPVITCPADITLDCGEDYLDLSITGTATGYDNCGAPTITHTDVVNISQCGTGTVTRTWKATDAGGRYKTCIKKLHWSIVIRLILEILFGQIIKHFLDV
ncbi:MAG: hypothetical protein R2766_03995 [Saprospiraceae bacterium]